MQKETMIKKLAAVKALAENGVGGEKETACRMYKDLKEKYGITDEEVAAVKEPAAAEVKQEFSNIAFAMWVLTSNLDEEMRICWDYCPYSDKFGRWEFDGLYKNPKHNRKQHTKKSWDSAGIPGADYFRELERISENQIIWGGNYFVEHLTAGHKGWIVWDKGQHGLTMSDCELAYSSFDSPTRIVVINRVELLKDGTFHPTQKPVKLYEWLLSNYAAAGDKIIDTHAGSGASCVACHNLRFDWMAFEIDPEYYAKADKRIKAEQAQMSIFDFMGG